MKKFIIVCLLLFPLAAYAGNSFMDKCVKSWIGYSLDSVTKSWGFPEYERTLQAKNYTFGKLMIMTLRLLKARE